MPPEQSRTARLAFVSKAFPSQFDTAVDEVASLMGPATRKERLQSDEYLAGFADHHPLGKLPAFRLMLAAFGDGMRLALRAAGSRTRFHHIDPAERRDILEALLWLITPGMKHLHSFDSATEALGLDPAWIRKQVYRALDMDAREIERFLRKEIPRTLAELPGRGRPRKRI